VGTGTGVTRARIEIAVPIEIRPGIRIKTATVIVVATGTKARIRTRIVTVTRIVVATGTKIRTRTRIVIEIAAETGIRIATRTEIRTRIAIRIETAGATGITTGIAIATVIITLSTTARSCTSRTTMITTRTVPALTTEAIRMDYSREPMTLAADKATIPTARTFSRTGTSDTARFLAVATFTSWRIATVSWQAIRTAIKTGKGTSEAGFFTGSYSPQPALFGGGRCPPLDEEACDYQCRNHRVTALLFLIRVDG
jgi:hypothetical protein